MYAVATFLVVASITMMFTQLASGALMATGVPPEIAKFQARSAFSGAGFTTTEAENVVNHPTRRKVIATTMFVGNLGTPTLVVTVLVGLIAPGPGSTMERSLVAASGFLLLLLAVGNRPMQRYLTDVGHRYAQRRLRPALGGEVEELLELGDGFVVGAVPVSSRPSDAPRSLRGLDEAFAGCKVLGVRQGQRFVGESPVDIELGDGDVIVLYGPRERFADLA